MLTPQSLITAFLSTLPSLIRPGRPGDQPVFVQLFCGLPRSVCNKHPREILKKASSNYPEVTLLLGAGLNNKQRQRNTNFLGFPPKICQASLRGSFNIFEIRVSVDHVGGQPPPPSPLFPVHLAAGGQNTARWNPENLISICDPSIGFDVIVENRHNTHLV